MRLHNCDFILRRADKAVYTAPWHSPSCMHRRNRALVDGSGLCLCYLTRKQGGTFYTVEYCRKQRVSVTNLAQAE